MMPAVTLPVDGTGEHLPYLGDLICNTTDNIMLLQVTILTD